MIRFTDYVQLNIGGDVGTTTPRQVEHAYPISTGLGTINWQVHSALKFRARDTFVEMVKG